MDKEKVWFLLLCRTLRVRMVPLLDLLVGFGFSAKGLVGQDWSRSHYGGLGL